MADNVFRIACASGPRVVSCNGRPTQLSPCPFTPEGLVSLPRAGYHFPSCESTEPCVIAPIAMALPGHGGNWLLSWRASMHTDYAVFRQGPCACAACVVWLARDCPRKDPF